MSNIQVYKAEAEAGLSELIVNNTIALDMQLSETKDQSIIDIGKAIASKNNPIEDLFPVDSVLVSVGWNKNDDVFDHLITWAARHTPIDKPFNLGHDEDDIIGHMTASFVQSGGQIVPDNTPDDQVPDIFDIIVSSVIYAKKKNEESQAKINQIIEEIRNNEWCVSMECLFRGFDFALISPDGVHRVIARDESTAMITPHLRIYGGDGYFMGNRVGRLLKDFTFSGKGLVRKPGNPRSIILNSFHGSKASLEELNNSETDNISEKENFMSDLLKEQLDAANARIAELEAGRDKNHETQITVANTKIDELNDTVKAQLEKIADLESQIADKNAEAEEIQKSHEKAIAEKDAKIDVLQKEKDQTEAARVAEARTNLLVEAGLEREEAIAKVEKFVALDDEAFSVYAEDMKKMKKDKDDKKKEEDEKAKAGQDPSGTLDSGTLQSEAGSIPHSDSADVQQKQEAVQSAFASWLAYSPEEEK